MNKLYYGDNLEVLRKKIEDNVTRKARRVKYV